MALSQAGVPTHPGNLKRMSFPGAINPQVTKIDSSHTLINVDPTLNTVLATLTARIQENYLKAKHLSLDAPSTGSIEFRPVAFTTQEALGTNYYVKLLVVNQSSSDKTAAASGQQDEYIHVMIFSQPWTQTAELKGIAVNKSLADSIVDRIAPILDSIPDATLH
ncbi:hypothetical protein BGZ65_003734 [Modicella reniformis]|uniref:Uncharacterized protein n=1 Tax=Modicella reniformis TaxID=1440133 RepID=A0A9P6MHW0_9FUNG|nr:hypothetical protein BGZ65_003734 [Modicella reniformis]